MSMAVDLNTPLTAEERAYLNERGRTAEIERADALNGVTDGESFAGDGTGPLTLPLGTADQAALRKEQLLSELRSLGVEVEVVDDGDEDESGEGGVLPYEQWSSEDLNAEIDRRNSDGRTEKISKAGKISERADRLYIDDENARS